MAAGPFIFPNKAKLNFVNATNLLAATAANYRIALVGSGWTPNNGDTGNEVWADVSTHEIAAGNGYSTGGMALPGVSLALSSGTVKFTSTAAVWTASGGTIPAWRRGVVYYLGTLNGKVNPLVGHFLGDASPADVPATANGGTLAVTPSTSGILSAS